MFAFLSPSKAPQITLLLLHANIGLPRGEDEKHPGKGALVLCLLQKEIILKREKSLTMLISI